MIKSIICDKCGSKKIMGNKETICPKCNNLEILPQDIALNIYERLNDWFITKFTEIIEEYDKIELILWLLEEREILVSDFFKVFPSLNFNRFFALNDLLKRAFKIYNVKGNKKPHYEDVTKLVDDFSAFIEVVESKKLLINEGFAYCVSKKPFDLQTIELNDLISNFNFYYDVDWINVTKSFEQNMIYPNDVAETYRNDHKEEYNKIKNSFREPIEYNPEQIIRNLYPTLRSLRDGLTETNLFQKMFDIRYLEKKQIPVEIFSTIVKCSKVQLDILMFTSRTELIRYIAEELKNINTEDIYNSFVFSENNQDVFPFFIEIERNIFISPNCLDLMKLYYIPVFYKNLFSNETQSRSVPFEKVEVPNKLKENGFKVIINKTDRKKSTLEIDSIAWKENKIYVIETKMWDTRIFFVHKQTHLQRERDLKGIVDGIEYRMRSNVIVEKEKPSLLIKIDYVKENLKDLCPDYEKITSVEGLIITRSYPPIKDYKGVKIIGFEEINNL
jgi:hypothetical protein